MLSARKSGSGFHPLACCLALGLFFVAIGLGGFLLIRRTRPLEPRQAEMLWSRRLQEREAFTFSGLAAGRDGTLYLAARHRPKVYRLAGSGHPLGVWNTASGQQKRAVMDRSPRGITRDYAGNIVLLLDSPANTTPATHLVTYNPDGKRLRRLPCAFMSDSVVALPGGSVVVMGGMGGPEILDANGKVVRRYGTGIEERTTPDPQRKQLYGRLAGADTEGNVFVLTTQSVLQRLDRNGQPGWKMENISAATMSPGGALYALRKTPRGNSLGRIVKLDRTGKIVGEWTSTQLYSDDHLAADGQGHLYTAFFPGEVRKFRLTGDTPEPLPPLEKPAVGVTQPGTEESEARGRALLTKAFRRLHQGRTFSADIQASRMNFNLKTPSVWKGVVFAQKPNRLCVDFNAHYVDAAFQYVKRELYVADGTHYYSDSRGYTENGQPRDVVQKRKLPSQPNGLPGPWEGEIDAFFGGTDVLRNQQVAYLGEEKVNGVDCVLVKTWLVDYPNVTYAVGKRDGWIHRVVIQQQSDVTLTNTLTKFRLDVPIPRQRFTFQPPKDREVVSAPALAP